MRHHIILISIDALRADRLSCYGHGRSTSPHIHALADEGVLFKDATSPATWTLPSHMSMLSGLMPPVHGCVSSLNQYPPSTLPFPLAFELLAKGGYDPAAVVGGGFMEAEFGFGRGVKNFDVIPELRLALDRVIDHVASSERTFTFLHSYIVHDYPRLTTQPDPLRFAQRRDPDYDGYFPTDRDFIAILRALAVDSAPPRLGRRDTSFIDDLYAAGVETADRAIKLLRRMFHDRGIWDAVTLIITSDHGESLGETHEDHQFWFHGGPPYKEQVQVPLIIKPAHHHHGLLNAPCQVEHPVSLCDLLPTMLDMEEISYRRDQFDGLSLVDLCLGQVAAFETRKLHYDSCEDPSNKGLAEHLYGQAFSWRDHSKVLLNSRTGELRELYFLDEDPAEQDNRLCDLTPDELNKLKEIQARYLEEVRGRAHDPASRPYEDNALLKRLAALGYLEE